MVDRFQQSLEGLVHVRVDGTRGRPVHSERRHALPQDQGVEQLTPITHPDVPAAQNGHLHGADGFVIRLDDDVASLRLALGEQLESFSPARVSIKRKGGEVVFQHEHDVGDVRCHGHQGARPFRSVRAGAIFATALSVALPSMTQVPLRLLAAAQT
jgi:hypothetical protein